MVASLRLARLAVALGSPFTWGASLSRDYQRFSATSRDFLSNYSSSWRNLCSHHHTAASRDPRRSLYFPRRAVMYVPASDQRKVAKTTTLSVDSLVFDIEDGVALNQKDAAREGVGAAIATSRRGDSSSRLSEHIIRVNGVDSGLLNSDLRAVFRSCDSHMVSPDALMLPKVESVEDVAQLDLYLSYHSPSPIPLHVIIESPRGLLNLTDITHYTTHHTHNLTLCSLVFGSDDYLASIGGVRTNCGAELVHVRQMIVGVACANGVSAIDMVSTDFTDLDRVRKEAEGGAGMGFTGKQVIHPAQVGVVQEAFTPPTHRVEWAKGLISKFELHQQTGQGAFVYEGQMIDRPLLLQAQNIVSLHGNLLRTNNIT